MEPKKRTLKQIHPSGPAKGKGNVDANSERNAAFYSQDGFSTCYPKKMVYPPEGREFQMEQLRAKLPLYCPPPSFCPLPLQEEVGGDDMEMTMACATNITLHPVMNKENVSVATYPKTSNTRRPLQQRDQPPPPLPHPTSLSPGEELERLCQEKQGQPSLDSVHVRRAGQGGDSTEDIGKVLEELVLQKSVERELERGGHKINLTCKVEHGGVSHRDNLSYLKHQENMDSVQANLQFPVSNRDKGCVARLNFSDAESSLGTSGQLSGLMEDSVGASLLSHSQIRNLEQSGRAGQSFEVFHDSWRSQSQNASHGGRTSAFQPVSRQQGAKYFGKPLERKPLQEVQASHQHESDLSSFADSCSQSQSLACQPSQGSMSSFSVFEDSREQSSFVPFHDSWASSSKDTGPGARQTSTGQQPKEQIGAVQREVVYRATLGVPLEGEGSGSGHVTTMDQSFTQIGICHPKLAPSISTPVSQKIDFTFDVSMIPAAGQTETEIISHVSTAHHPNPCQQAPPSHVLMPAQRKRSAVSAATNLSTIKEESSSLKSSYSSNSTASSQSRSSASSQSSHESVGHMLGGDPDFEVNPFLPQFVHKMLNALSPRVLENVCMVSAHLPQLVQGRSVTLGKFECGNIKKVTSGGFGAIYTCKQGKETKVLKVQKPPLKWEMAIICELHSRLCSSNLKFGSACFVDVEQSFLFDNASVMVLPYYHLGSMLDLVNAHHSQRVNESCVFYYASELLEMVASLHHCGILHTDIKPDNLMLKDIRPYGNFAAARGHGLCLLDFGRAVDLTAFPDETLFQGSCETEGFQCTQMLEGKPWKYEVDYFGIAATVHVLLTGQYMSVFKDTKTNQYQLQKPLPRTRNTSLWSGFFNCLLNTTQPLPLSDMAQELYAKVKGLKSYMFNAYVKGMTETAVRYLSQRS